MIYKLRYYGVNLLYDAGFSKKILRITQLLHIILNNSEEKIIKDIFHFIY